MRMIQKETDKFFAYLREYLTIYLPKQRRCSPNTVKSYQDAFNLYRTFLSEIKGIPFVKITLGLFDYTTINEFLDWLQSSRGCGASTRNQRLAAMNSFLNYVAIQDPTMMEHYVKVKSIPAQKTGNQPLKSMSEEAVASIIRQPDISKPNGRRDRFFLILLYDTAARMQEILDIRICDIHLNASSPYLYLTGKGNKTRQIPLMGKTISHMESYFKEFHPEMKRSPQSHLFYTVIKGQAGPMSPENVACFLRRYGNKAREGCEEVPEKLHAHIFRHARAMSLYKSGIPLSYIKEYLGHSHINTTSIYAMADMEMMRNALEKASYIGTPEQSKAVWEGDEEMILRLCGLR